MQKNTRFQRWFLKKIFWGIAPRPPYWGGATAPLRRPHPPRRSGVSRLRASCPSIDECGVQKIPYIILWRTEINWLVVYRVAQKTKLSYFVHIFAKY